MVFNSIVFLVFFVLFYSLYWHTGMEKRVHLRNAFIIVASYIFYAWWDARFLALIFISSLADYILALLIHRCTTSQNRKYYLFLSLLINLGMLGFFKYYNFFIESLVDSFRMFNVSLHVNSLNIILPVGISFYTFQTLSYTLDVYYKRMAPTKNVLAFFAFVSFFPQLVAGPVERARNLLPQFLTAKSYSFAKQSEGLRYILYGLFKKVVVADGFALIADTLFADVANYNGVWVLIGAIAFAIQIYCDFSGYSDMAIGLSKLLGFDLMQNFSTPYFSTSFTEFWQRWHISLSSWFRDYVYFPLGGNKKGTMRRNGNLIITFALSGLWHGAKFTFVIWGLLHGIALVIEKHLTKWKRLKFAAGFLYFCLPVSLDSF
jgi:Predicted membrane protein involved in D-alanine export